MYTTKEKLACVQRELALRRNVYAKRMAMGKMKPVEAAREIALMEAIVEDYQNKLARESAPQVTTAELLGDWR